MPALIKRLIKSGRGRLSRRIVFWVFISVIVIETIILIPSFRKREKELVSHLKEVTAARVQMIVELSAGDTTERQFFERITRLHKISGVLGGALYRSDGTAVGVFGESPPFSVIQTGAVEAAYVKAVNNSRYDFVYRPDQLPQTGALVLRLDAAPIQNELYAFTLRIAGLVLIISVFVTAGSWFALNPIVVKPILRLRSDLVNAGESISQDRYQTEFYTASVQRRDELGEVIKAFRNMYKQITDAIDTRKQTEEALQQSFEQANAYSRALNNELEKGRQMQSNFLPGELLVRPGWEFAAYFKPARQVAGDFYDVFELPDDNVGIVIADVCDKGVGAALFMALFRSLIRIFSGQTTLDGLACLYDGDSLRTNISEPQNKSLHPQHLAALKAIQHTNKYIAENHGELAMFATLFFGVIDPTTGILTYINAGHEPLYVIEPNGGVQSSLRPTGPALGISSEVTFKIQEMRLKPGEVLLGYTDGVVEARSKQDQFYTQEKLLSLLEESVISADSLLYRVASEVISHINGAEQYDDITLLAIRRLPQPREL
jgi:serine phosphatase RsbU (regulator of sigma subunit)